MSNLRRALADSHVVAQQTQDSLWDSEQECDVKELRVLRKQIQDLESLQSNSLSHATQHLLLEEQCVLRTVQEHLAQKCGISIDSIAQEEMVLEADLSCSEDSDSTVPSDNVADALFSNMVVKDVEHSASETTPPCEAAEDVQVSTCVRDPEIVRHRIAELIQFELECSQRMEGLEQRIQEACDSDCFDDAEELEEQRRTSLQELDAIHREHKALSLELNSLEKALSLELCENKENDVVEHLHEEEIDLPVSEHTQEEPHVQSDCLEEVGHAALDECTNVEASSTKEANENGVCNAVFCGGVKLPNDESSSCLAASDARAAPGKCDEDVSDKEEVCNAGDACDEVPCSGA